MNFEMFCFSPLNLLFISLKWSFDCIRNQISSRHSVCWGSTEYAYQAWVFLVPWPTINPSDCHFFPWRSSFSGSAGSRLLLEIRQTPHGVCVQSTQAFQRCSAAVSRLRPPSLPRVFSSLETSPPSLICMLSVCSFVNHRLLSRRQQSNNTSLSDLWVYLWNVLTSFFFVVVLLFFFFNPSSHCRRMTQIGNTISGVTGLRSVWWMLVTLSPSLLTPGSRCMHGRSELNALHKLHSIFFLHIRFQPCLFLSPSHWIT